MRIGVFFVTNPKQNGLPAFYVTDRHQNAVFPANSVKMINERCSGNSRRPVFNHLFLVHDAITLSYNIHLHTISHTTTINPP